jgi:hypothetical protein
MQPFFSYQLSLFLSTVTHLAAKLPANLMILSRQKLWVLALAKTQGQSCVQNRQTNATGDSSGGKNPTIRAAFKPTSVTVDRG